MTRYVIVKEDNYLYLCSNNSVRFQYWSCYDYREVIRYNLITGYLMLIWIRINWLIEGNKEKIKLQKESEGQ